MANAKRTLVFYIFFIRQLGSGTVGVCVYPVYKRDGRDLYTTEGK